MSRGVVRLDADRLAIRGDRLVELASFLQRHAKVVVSLGVVRLDADRLAIGGDRLVELALALERIADVGMGLGQVGFDADNLAIRGDRLVQLALVLERYAEVEVSPDIIRLDADRLAIRGDRLGELALALERYTEVGMGLGMVRLGCQHPPITRLGLGQSSPLVVLETIRQQFCDCGTDRGRCSGTIVALCPTQFCSSAALFAAHERTLISNWLIAFFCARAMGKLSSASAVQTRR